MTVEEKFAAILTPVFGDELYPVVHPDPDGLESSVSNLYAIYVKIGGRRFGSLEGDGNLRRTRVQVSIYASMYPNGYADIKAKEAELEAAMLAANTLASQCVDSGTDPLEVLLALPNVAVAEPTDDYEPDTKRFVLHSEWYAWCRS